MSVTTPAAPDALTVCVLGASPRRAGACAALAERVAAGVRDGGARVDLQFLADYAIAGCTGCGACERTGACVLDAREAGMGPSGFRDAPAKPGFAWLRAHLETADALVIVAPVYFSGPPSQLKAALDRMQPLWCRRYLLGTRPLLPPEQRKPLDLAVVGAGGDPFGHDALVSCVRSALRMADFELRGTHDFIGYRAPGRPGSPDPARPVDADFERRAYELGLAAAHARAEQQAGDAVE